MVSTGTLESCFDMLGVHKSHKHISYHLETLRRGSRGGRARWDPSTSKGAVAKYIQAQAESRGSVLPAFLPPVTCRDS